MTEYLRKSTWKRKDLFWITVSEVSVDAHVAPLLQTCGEAEHHGKGGMVEQRRSPQGGRKQREEEGRDWGQDIAFQEMPPKTSFLNGPYLLQFPPLFHEVIR